MLRSLERKPNEFHRRHRRKPTKVYLKSIFYFCACLKHLFFFSSWPSTCSSWWAARSTSSGRKSTSWERCSSTSTSSTSSSWSSPCSEEEIRVARAVRNSPNSKLKTAVRDVESFLCHLFPLFVDVFFSWQQF